MNAFIEVLERDASFTDLVALTLDILDCTLTDMVEDELAQQSAAAAAEDEIGDRLAELMLQKPGFMPALIKLLAGNEFSVRRFVNLFIPIHPGDRCQPNLLNLLTIISYYFLQKRHQVVDLAAPAQA
jgi:hypothetical protein